MDIATSALLPGTNTMQKLDKALPQVISFLLVIAVSYSLAQFSWQFYLQLQDQEAQIAATNIGSTAAIRSKPKQSVRKITSSHLFGKTNARSGAPVPSKAPVTKLNLVLRGVLAAEPSSLATAIIAAGKGGKEEVYSIGDTIQRGVKLSEIHSNHVIIDRQGKLEKLVLVKSLGSVASTNRRPNLKRASASPDNLRDIRKEIMKNPTSFGEYALPVVVKQNGKQIGYRLKPQKKGELLSEYGLQPSDIITEINGVKLDKPQNGIRALRQLSTASQVKLIVKRGQSFVPLNIQLQ